MNALRTIEQIEQMYGHNLGQSELIEIIMQQSIQIDKLESDLKISNVEVITLRKEVEEMEKGSLKCLQVIESKLKMAIQKIEEGEKNVKKVSQ